MTDIQKHTITAQPFHFMIDGTGDDIPGRELCPGIEFGHEMTAVRQFQFCPLSAQGLGNEERFGMGVKQAGWMKLVELHVANPTARPPGHGDTIAAGAVGIGGVEISLAGATGSEHHEAGFYQLDIIAALVEDVAAHADAPVALVGGLYHLIYSGTGFNQVDVGVGLGPRLQRFEYGLAGGVGGMNDTTVAVAAFLGEME